MGSNARRTGNPADKMAGRTLGWGTRAENKSRRKEMRHSANQADIDLGLADYHDAYLQHGYGARIMRRDEPCYCNMQGCYTCDPEYILTDENKPISQKKKKKGCKGKEKPHDYQAFKYSWEYPNGMNLTSFRLKCENCGKIIIDKSQNNRKY